MKGKELLFEIIFVLLVLLLLLLYLLTMWWLGCGDYEQRSHMLGHNYDIILTSAC